MPQLFQLLSQFLWPSFNVFEVITLKIKLFFSLAKIFLLWPRENQSNFWCLRVNLPLKTCRRFFMESRRKQILLSRLQKRSQQEAAFYIISSRFTGFAQLALIELGKMKIILQIYSYCISVLVIGICFGWKRIKIYLYIPNKRKHADQCGLFFIWSTCREDAGVGWRMDPLLRGRLQSYFLRPLPTPG